MENILSRTDATTIFKPGSILINTSTNKLYGVLVSLLPQSTIQSQSQAKIIVFRLDKNTHPIFSKFELHPNVAKVGIINEAQYSSIKSALLKHYRTYNLTLTEKNMLQPLMNFAFPLGIPEYQPDVELPERDLQMMDLNSKLITGSRILINTPNKSSYLHLDGKIVNIIDKNEKGLWVNTHSNEQDMTKLNNSLYFLFYKNSSIPTFGGISRITPIIEDNIATPILIKNSLNIDMPNIDSNNTGLDANNSCNIIQEAFQKMKMNDELITTMEFNGDKVRIIPKTMKIIFPEIYSGMYYNPNSDTFIADSNNISSALSKKLGAGLMFGKDVAGKTM
jgi:hypothetical protein